MTKLKEKYKAEIIKKMKESFGYSSISQVPKIFKVTVNTGVGRIKESDDEVAQVVADLALITGQKPRSNKSRKSISGFKLREGQVVGLSCTLRGNKMFDFTDRLVNVALPRIRDFRGLPLKSFDGKGGYSIGIKEQTIFPEIKYEKSRSVFGLQVNISTSSKTDNEAKKLLEYFGFPFAKDKKQTDKPSEIVTPEPQQAEAKEQNG